MLEEQNIPLEEKIIEQEIEVYAETFVGGTRNYERLENKPQINSVELIGNKSSSELGLASISDLDDAINDLADQIDAETTEREADVEELTEDLNSLGDELNAEINARTQAITTLENSVATKASSADLTSEINARTQAVTSLQSDLNTKATISALTSETTNRENADIQLQNQIDAITSKTDIVDIVGTKAQLNAYDTSKLGDNDIVKVLTDSTHDNAPSYYRWKKTANAWEYVGSEAITYTKGEADDRFVPKTRTINGKALSSNVTLTTNDITNNSGYVKNTDYSTDTTAGVVRDANCFLTSSENGGAYAEEMSYATYNEASDYNFIGKGTLENVIAGKGLIKNTDIATGSKPGIVMTNATSYGLQTATSGNLQTVTKTYAQYQTVSNACFVGKGTLENVLNGRKYLIPELTQELPTTGEENKLYLVPTEEQPDVEAIASGEKVDIEAVDGSLVDWEIMGNIQQEEGASPTTPKEIQTVTGSNTIFVRGTNWFDGEYEIGGINSTGNNDGSTDRIRTKNFIRVSPSSQFTIWEEQNNSLWCAFYTEGKEFISLERIIAPNTSNYVSFSTPANCGFIRWYHTSTTNTSMKAQLQFGNSLNDYEDFHGGEVEINLGDIELRGIGDYQDVIYKDGDEWKLERHIGMIRAGDMAWTGYNNVVHYYTEPTSGGLDIANLGNPTLAIASTHFIANNSGADGTFYYNGSNRHLNIYGTSEMRKMTGTAFKAWLNTNNVMLYYALANPVIETIVNETLIEQLNLLDSLTTQEGKNFVSTDTPNVLPTLRFAYFRPDPAVTKDEWLWVENHYEQLGGKRKFTHNISVNASTSVGHWNYSCHVTNEDNSHYTQVSQLASFLNELGSSASIPVSGTYVEGNNVYIITKITAHNSYQVNIEMRKLSDGSLRSITTGAVSCTDFVL